MKTKLLLLLLLAHLSVFSQRITVDTVFNGWLTTVSYDPSFTDSTEIFLVMHGAGEVGTSTRFTHNYGPQYYIDQGWNPNIMLGNGLHKPVYVTIQAPAANQRPWVLKPVIDQIQLRYKGKKRALHGMALSQGSWVFNIFASYEPTFGDYTYHRYFTSLTNIQGVRPSDAIGVPQLTYPTRYGFVAKNFGLTYFGFENVGDSRKIDEIVDAVLDSGGVAYHYWTTMGNSSHCCFNEYYDPNKRNWTLANTADINSTKSGTLRPTIPFEAGYNIYEKVIRTGDTTLGGAPAQNQAPIVNVGADVSITLPNSSVSRTASVTDEGGAISFTWTKQSGPAATISSPTALYTDFTGLTQGTYVFRGTAIDTGGLAGYDEFTVVVNAAGNTPPTASAGGPQTITLPTASVTLNGTSGDPDGTVASRAWSQVSGPNTGTFGSPTTNSTTFSNLIQGTYRVRFAVTDNSGATTADTVTITVNPAVTGEEQSVFVNIYGGTNAFNNSQWNNWNTTSSASISNLKYISGATSPFSVSISSQISVTDNLAGYGGTIMPDTVLRYATYSTSPRTLTISGLNPGKQYTFVLVASRRNTDNTTNFVINSVTQGVYVNNNTTSAATFVNITPNSSGVVTINMDRVNTSSGNYLNGFKIIQQGTGEVQNEPPVVTAGVDQFITLPTNATNLAATATDPDGTIASVLWTQISGPTVGNILTPTSVNTIISNLEEGDYIFEFEATDNDGAKAADRVTVHVVNNATTPVSVYAGKDSTLALAQWNDVLGKMDTTKTTLKGSGSGITTWLWTQLSGPNTLTIVSPNAQNTLVRDFQVGNYKFRLAASNGANTVYDTIEYRVVNYQTKGQAPCRTGAPVTWTLTRTNATEITRTYLRRDGMNIQGGDTVRIPGGLYRGISLGDFGGNPACPVHLVPGSDAEPIVRISNSSGAGFFRFGNSAADTNFVSHVVIHGDYWKASKGINYAFQHIDSTPSKNSTGVVFNLCTDITVKGLLLYGHSVGIMAKLDSDSSRPWRIYNNFRMKNMKFLHNQIRRIDGEGFYVGHTSPNGDNTQQAANNGHTVRMDSVEIAYNFVDSTTWDGFQVSNAIYADIHDNIGTRLGVLNGSSQRAAGIIGGNTRGYFRRNIIYNSKEGLGVYGYGRVEVSENYMDSIRAATTTSDGIYASSNGSTVIETRPPLKVYVTGNTFNRIERRAYFGANNSSMMGAGKVSNNRIVDATRSLSQMIGSNANDTIENNVLITEFPVEVRQNYPLGEAPVIQVTKNGVLQTFSTVEDALEYLEVLGEEVNTPPTVVPLSNLAITLPTNSVFQNVSATDNGAVTYLWEKISGPASFIITLPTSPATTFTNLVAGTYIFRCTVTDTGGLTASTQFQVVVHPEESPEPTDLQLRIPKGRKVTVIIQ